MKNRHTRRFCNSSKRRTFFFDINKEAFFNVINVLFCWSLLAKWPSGKMSMDNIFRERESLNVSIVEAINKAAGSWGIL
jgi:hypothetical protein